MTSPMLPSVPPDESLVQSLPAFRAECSSAHFASRIATRTALAARRRGAQRPQVIQYNQALCERRAQAVRT